jgi:Leucine-rich repeat (LRR) protein
LVLLALKWNKINKISGLSNQYELMRLELSYNSITEIQGLENLNNLINLDLRHNPVEKEIIEIDPKKNLKVLVKDLETREIASHCRELLRKK